MKKFLTIIILFILIIQAIPSEVFAAGSIDSAFNPNLLITDEAFSDAGTFGSAEAVQKFLNDKGSILATTSTSFLAKLKEPETLTKVGLEDPEPDLGRLRTAAELIFDATAKTGLNIQVILVTLQKEQSLITGDFASGSSLQTALDHAMGFGCPDSAPCQSIFSGFYFQLFGNFDSNHERYLGSAASLMKSFNNTVNGKRVGRGPSSSKIGDIITLDNTQGGFSGVVASQSVTLSNFATTALYRYTPHVFNGNYNFWKYFTLWFKYPNGTIIRKIGQTGLFLISDNGKQLFSQFVASQRKIKLNQIVDVSPTEFDSYVTGPQLTPLDGTLVKGDADASVYLIQNGIKQAISGAIFTQRKFSFKKVITLPQQEVIAYGTGSFLPPLDGTLITGDTDKTVYLIAEGVKRPITAAVFAARKLSFRNLMHLSDGEVTAIASGVFLTPPDAVQIQLTGDSGIYWYKNGQKQYVSAFVFKQRGVGNFPRVTLGLDEFTAIPTGTPFPPKDGTVIKGDATDGIYKVASGVKQLLTPASYKRLGYPKPVILPQAELDSYAEGAILDK